MSRDRRPVARAAGDAVLITIDRPGQIPSLRLVLRALGAAGRPHRVVALELAVFEELCSAEIAVELIDDLVDARVQDRVDREARELAHGWFRVPCGAVTRDLTCYRGVSLGRLVAWEMSYFFAEAIRCQRNVESLLAAVRPGAVLVLADPIAEGSLLLQPSENFHHDAFEVACRARHIPCELSAGPAAPSAEGPDPGAVASLPPTGGDRPRSSSAGARATVLTAGVRSVTPAMAGALFARGFERLLVLGHAGGLDQGDPRVVVTSVEAYSRPGDGERAGAVLGRRWQSRAAAIGAALARRVPDLADLPCVRRRLHLLFHGRLALAYRRHLGYRRLLRTEDVGAVLLHDDVTEDGRGLALAARREAVPSLVLLHGAVGHPIGALPVVADRIGVYGPHFTRWFREHGVAAERLAEIGSPRFVDVPPERRRHLRRATRDALGVADDQRLVVLALQHCNRATWFANVHWSHREWRRLVQAALAAAASRPDVSLLVKLHPAAEDAGLWTAWIAGRAPLVQVLPGESLLAAADALVTGWSTLGLEAVLAGVPLVTVNFTGRPTPLELGRLGLSDHVEHPGDLAATLDRALTAPRPVDPEAIARMLVRGGADAASHAAAVVADLAGRHGRRPGPVVSAHG